MRITKSTHEVKITSAMKIDSSSSPHFLKFLSPIQISHYYLTNEVVLAIYSDNRT